jgi:adenylate kinase
MADQLVDTLKATVDKLEKRIEDLESRLQGNSSSSGHGSSDGMRMILIGPPGAGMIATVTR